MKNFLKISVLSFLCSCATSAYIPKTEDLYPNLNLSPASFNNNISLNQNISIKMADKNQDMTAILEINPSKITLVGMALEQRILTIIYDGENLQTWKNNNLPEYFNPEIIFNTLQLALWSKKEISKNLPKFWAIKENNLERTIYLKDKLIIKITYSNAQRYLGTIYIKDFRYPYELKITSIILE